METKEGPYEFVAWQSYATVDMVDRKGLLPHKQRDIAYLCHNSLCLDGTHLFEEPRGINLVFGLDVK